MKDSKNDILTFWFDETAPTQQQQESDAFDAIIRKRFARDYDLAAGGIFDSWLDTPDGCVALCLLLGLFPRFIFRGASQAFETDGKALAVAARAIDRHFDTLLPMPRRLVLYWPFGQSELLADQDRYIAMLEPLRAVDPVTHGRACRNREIIARFGRFPARNDAIGRPTTPDEQAYLSGAAVNA